MTAASTRARPERNGVLNVRLARRVGAESKVAHAACMEAGRPSDLRARRGARFAALYADRPRCMTNPRNHAVAAKFLARPPLRLLTRLERCVRFASIVICVALAEPARAGADQATTLSLDPSVTRGAIANGVSYWIAPQPSAAGVAIWMRVDAGSLQEEEEESGLAHFVEHLAFRGTRHYPDGAVIRRFEALGLTIGVDENAITTPRGTIYKMTLAAGDAWREGLRMMADFAYRRETTARAVDDERRVVMAEMRAADGRASRLERRITAATFAGSRAASRSPMGRPDVIERASVADVERFLARWYRPERTTVLVAGRIDPATVAAASRANSAGSGPRPRRRARTSRDQSRSMRRGRP